MMRETKVGLVVAGSFLSLAGGTFGLRMYQNSPAAGGGETEVASIAPPTPESPAPIAQTPAASPAPIAPPPAIDNSSVAAVPLSNQPPLGSGPPANQIPVPPPADWKPSETANNGMTQPPNTTPSASPSPVLPAPAAAPVVPPLEVPKPADLTLPAPLPSPPPAPEIAKDKPATPDTAKPAEPLANKSPESPLPAPTDKVATPKVEDKPQPPGPDQSKPVVPDAPKAPENNVVLPPPSNLPPPMPPAAADHPSAAAPAPSFPSAAETKPPTDKPPSPPTVPGAAKPDVGAGVPGSAPPTVPDQFKPVETPKTPEPTPPVPSGAVISTVPAQLDIPKRPEGGAPRPLSEVFPTGGAKPISAPKPSTNDSYLEEEYRTQAGDTFTAISRRFLNSEKYANALQQYNRDYPIASANLRSDPPRLGGGQIVWIPPIRVLERRYPHLIQGLNPAPKGDANWSPTTSGAKPIPSGPGYKPYRVREARGETMAEIARRTLDTPARWSDVYRLNPNLNPSATVPIPMGTLLRLPADAKVD